MSNINTANINANYPIAGQNNSSQGFRDNFGSIVTNFNAASNEITDLQQKAILTSSLTDGANLAVQNNLNGAPLSNAVIQGFKSKAVNVLQNSVSGNTITIDTTQADVYSIDFSGSLNFSGTGAINVAFANWTAVAGSQAGQVTVVFNNIGNKTIGLPSIVNGSKYTIENYNPATNTFTAPFDVSTNSYANSISYTFSTLDCGASITMNPVSIPRAVQQVVPRTPSSSGSPGDTLGSIAVDNTSFWVCTGNYTGQANSNIWTQLTTNPFPSYIKNGNSGVTIPDVNGSVYVFAGLANITDYANATASFFSGGMAVSNILTNSISSQTGEVTINTTMDITGDVNVSLANITVGNGNLTVSSALSTSGFVKGRLIIDNSLNPPASTSSNGVTGQVAFDAAYIYVCIGTNTWKRANLNSW